MTFRSATAVAGLVASAVLILAILASPNRLDLPAEALLSRIPLEVGALVLVLMVGGGSGRVLRGLVKLLLVTAVVLKLADMACHAAYARPFNAVLDVGLAWAVVDTLEGVIGLPALIGLGVGLLVAMALLVLAVHAAVECLSGLLRRRRVASVGALAAASLLVAVAAAGGMVRPGFDTARLMGRHAVAVGEGVADMNEFRRLAAQDAWADVPADRLLTALRGKDVVLVFVESYGSTVLTHPDYAGVVRPLLAAAGRDLAAAGLTVRSASLVSPTAGGLSWLAHGTLLSGLWVDNQRRYASLVASDRMTLNKAFRKAGWRTVAIMPAIQLAWPEGSFYGYDRIRAADDLGYRGKPFNWVTMPDQYTLSAFDALERGGPADRPPVMAEIALISSHAPWTPIPDLVDWSAVGDGTIFDEMAVSGDTPAEVWKDPDRVRLQFRLSIEYAMRTLASYAVDRVDEDTVLIVLGDHQPAPIVTGPTEDRSVPVHVIARDPDVIAAIEPWGWSEGMLPDDAPVWRMDAFRDRFLEAYSRR